MHRLWNKNILLCFILISILPILFFSHAFGQNIKGRVLDQLSGEPLPYVNIRLKWKDIGAFSNSKGEFELNPGSDTATIVFSYLGFQAQELLLSSEDSLKSILLISEDVMIEEVAIRPEYSYDLLMFKKVLAHKKQNDPDNREAIEHLKYAKTFVFLGNLDGSFQNKRLFKNSQAAFCQDSDSSAMLPVFLTEELTWFGKADPEILETKTNGVLPALNDQIETLITGQFDKSCNFYKNQIQILSRGFTSPLSRNALLSYNIYLADSSLLGETKYYQFDFYPKNAKNITFKGQFTVEDGTFALTEIRATLPNSANINYVSDLEILVSYKKNDLGEWFYDQQKVNMNMSLKKAEGNKKKGKAFTVHKNIDFQLSREEGISQDQIALLRTVGLNGNSGTLGLRPLDGFEKEAYAGIEVLKQNRALKIADRIGAMGITGFFNAGAIDIGPFYDFYRNNRIEGHRITVPLRTSENVSTDFSLNAYLGYGTASKEFKYGAGFNYRLPTKTRTILTFNYSNDYASLSRNKYIEFVRENTYSNGDGNLISSFSETPNSFLLGKEEVSLSLKFQTKKDIGLLVRPFQNTYKSTDFVPFRESSGDASYARFENRGVLLDARFSFNQDYDDGFFSRFYYGNNRPVIHLTAELGQNKLAGKRKEYAHLQVSIKNKINFGPAYLRLLIDGGYIMGQVPFPLLHMPRGSQSLGLARYNYSLMQQAAFASDLYTNSYLSLNGGGLLFNKLPLIKKLNLRESLSLKTFYGRLKGNHDALLALPKGIHKAPNEPYMELGLGVCNLFKVLRVEYVRRLNQSKLMDLVSSKSGIRLRLEVGF